VLIDLSANRVSFNLGTCFVFLSVARAFSTLVLLKVFRVDRLLAGSVQLIGSVFGPQFLKLEEYDFGDVAVNQSKSSAPLLLCSAPGFDASVRVDELAARANPKTYKCVYSLLHR
jgi:dynein heavy chain 1